MKEIFKKERMTPESLAWAPKEMELPFTEIWTTMKKKKERKKKVWRKVEVRH